VVFARYGVEHWQGSAAVFDHRLKDVGSPGRRMFFLLDGLLDRLIYLSLGLAGILGFVGVKLIVHATHEAWLDVPEVSTDVSLTVILLTLAVTVVASLAKVREAPEVYATHDVTGHHHPPGDALEELRTHGRHPQLAVLDPDRDRERADDSARRSRAAVPPP
jgi:hypothetical protein